MFAKKNSFFDLKKFLGQQILKKGGFVNAHAHLDRSYTLNKHNFFYSQKHLHEKWVLVDELKKRSTISQIYDRMAYSLENFLRQKVQAVGSFIDVDEVIKDKAIKAAQRIKDRYQKSIKIKFINQTLKGVLKKESYYWFKIGAEFCDIIGSLPAKDHPHEERHLDVVFQEAKRLKKIIHAHVDQLNTQKEKETEILAKKTLEYNYQGKVVAIHSISLAAHSKSYREKIYSLMKKAKLMVVSCPFAWIDSSRSEEKTVTHNAITPIDEMTKHQIVVALGTDNIVDIYKPFNDGDMWLELRLLLEANRFYQLEKLVEIATINGLKVLDLIK